jgi:hypothetical protein
MQRRDEKCTQNLAGKPEDRKLFGRPRSTWENNIKIELVKREYLYGIQMAQERSCERRNETSDSIY